jgi:hypothetical protein
MKAGEGETLSSGKNARDPEAVCSSVDDFLVRPTKVSSTT